MHRHRPRCHGDCGRQGQAASLAGGDRGEFVQKDAQGGDAGLLRVPYPVATTIAAAKAKLPPSQEEIEVSTAQGMVEHNCQLGAIL